MLGIGRQTLKAGLPATNTLSEIVPSTDHVLTTRLFDYCNAWTGLSSNAVLLVHNIENLAHFGYAA